MAVVRLIGRGRMRVFASVVLVAAVLLLPSTAVAYPAWDSAGTPVPGATCDQCHSKTSRGGTEDWDGVGPHGNYMATTSKCSLCHTIHNAPSDSVLLLRGTTVTGTCLMCHDGTGAGPGVYNSITSYGGEVTREHSYDLTGVVPGGTDLTHNLSCSDCHSVHGANCVTPFIRDGAHAFYPDWLVPATNSLLRSDLKGTAAGTYPTYGGQWCAACHKERHSDSSTTLNHPVEASASFGYGEVTSTPGPTYPLRAYGSEEAAVGGYMLGMGQTNAGYVMAPVTAVPDGRVDARQAPMCQQCHEDVRDVEQPYSGDAYSPGIGNPAYLTFPHQSTNLNMLVEEYDDLCLNCHTQPN